MKVRNYDQVLKARGYECIKSTKYQGTNVYVKKHTYNVITCMVGKDAHGKAQEMWFTITDQFHPDTEVQKKIDLDAEYLFLEAKKIRKAFEQLKQMKAPKHIYF